MTGQKQRAIVPVRATVPVCCLHVVSAKRPISLKSALSKRFAEAETHSDAGDWGGDIARHYTYYQGSATSATCCLPPDVQQGAAAASGSCGPPQQISVHAMWLANPNDIATCCLSPTPQMCRVLLQLGANMNLYNKIGFTSFSCACMNGEAAISEYMITLGADVNGGSRQPLFLTCKAYLAKMMYRCGCCHCFYTYPTTYTLTGWIVGDCVLHGPEVLLYLAGCFLKIKITFASRQPLLLTCKGTWQRWCTGQECLLCVPCLIGVLC